MQCAALKNIFAVTTAGFSPTGDPSIAFIQLTAEKRKPWFNFHLELNRLFRAPFSLLNKFQFYLSGSKLSFPEKDYKELSKHSFDLIICHHPASLDLAFKLKSKYNCKLIFNAHEIYSLEFEDDPQWMKNNFNIIDGLLRKYLPQCDRVFSVNQEICDFYIEQYKCKCVPVHNSKPYHPVKAGQVYLPMRVIHHGGAMPQRKLEQMADAVLSLPDKYALTFMLVNTNNRYLSELKAKYEPLGIKFIDTVPYSEIIHAINSYDIGLYILPQGNINQQLALPNKLFEFLQAKLAIICSPNKAMKNLVTTNKIGAVAEGFETSDMIKLLKSLTPEQVYSYKKRCEEVASELSSASDEERILNTVSSLLN